MISQEVPRNRMGLIVACLAIAAILTTPGQTGSAASARSNDPAMFVPLDRIAPVHRDGVSEVIRDHTVHCKGAPETFPCHPKVYLCLLNEPALTLALWQDLAESPVRLRQVGPDRYEGTDGAGASATWEFVYRSPKLHVLLCNLTYNSPRGSAHLDARIVLLVHSGYYREVNGEQWVQHDVEAFVKVDSRGWKAVARTIRPVIEKLLDDQVREAGWFVSLMGRLVAMYPNWACQVTASHLEIAQQTRSRFHDLVVQTRRSGAFTGRPSLAENRNPSVQTR
ncbi:MAG: hypothetical protein NVSMB9_34930 [Isosphaeraceae bacterium]